MDRNARAIAAQEWFLLGAAAVALAGMATLLLITRWGIGTSPDSVHYIRAARALLGPSPDIASSGEALVQHAPFYSWLLASVHLVGLDPLDGARWLNGLLFALNIFLVAVIVRQSSRHISWLWLPGSLLMFAVPVLIVHVSALSEPAFLSLTLSGFYLLARYLESSRQPFLIGAGLAIGLSVLTRYAGVACILTGAVALLISNQATIGRRVRAAFLFGFISCAPMLVWMVRNMAAAGTATGRDLVFHLIERAQIWQALYTASNWLLIPDSAPNLIRFVVWLAIAARVGVVLRRYAASHAVIPPMIAILALFIGVYAAFLVASISLFDANTPLDDRILVPAFVAGLIVLLYLLDDWWPQMSVRPMRLAVGVGLAVFVGFHLVSGATLATRSHADGWGFSSLAWQRSAILDQVRRLPAGSLIYSNAPEIVYLHTGRSVQSIPKKWLPMNRQPNPRFQDELKALEQRLSAEHGVVVFLDRVQSQVSVPREQELMSQLALSVQTSEEDGVILGLPSRQ